MSKQKQKVNELDNYLIWLQEAGIRHTLKSCSSSSSIKIEHGRNYFFPNGEPIEQKYLNFIKATKKEVCNNATKLNLKEQCPKFIKFSPLFADNFFSTEFVEIDISGAYWFTAYDFGLLSLSTYEIGLTVPKKVRLMALGSAAATKDIMYFDGLEYEHKGVEFDKFGRMAFFAVAKRVDEIMSMALDLLHGNAVFYWVDALFVRRNFADYAAAMIEDFGYSVTQTPLLWLKGDAMEKKITGCRILAQRETMVCWEFKTYYKPRKTKHNAKSI